MTLTRLPIAVALLVIAMTSSCVAQEPTEEQQADLNRLAREWGYIQAQAQAAIALVGETAELAAVNETATQKIAAAAAGDLALLAGWGPLEDPGMREDLLDATEMRKYSVAVLQAVQDTGLLATFADPWTRHEPTWVPPTEPVQEAAITVLRDEQTAAAFTLSNATDTPIDCRIAIDGLDAPDFEVTVRRQVYLETWYGRERSGIYDAMPPLVQEDGAWRVSVPSGEAVRVHVQIGVGESAGSADADIVIRPEIGDEQRLALSVEVLPAAPPAESRFENVAFLYPELTVCGRSPEAAAEDLGAHHVTMIEFPSMPRASFNDDGELLEADFARHDRWMDTYAPYVDRMMIFWHGDIEREDGTVWAMHSPQWRRAYISLLRGWLDHNIERGFGPERFVLLVADELHSGNLADAPDEHVQAVVGTMGAVREAIPELKIYQTLTYYAFPADVELMAPVTDFACVALPWPERLTRNAPPEYNPRRAWDEEIGPMLRANCEQLGSYHVASGKSDSQLQWNYAYPLVALGQGMTGVGHWAYNVARASTWHDWDGTGDVRLDYVFVYDGAEDHERNRRLNPTGELVVPSIRWEALREGIQVAKLLLALRDARDAGELPVEVAGQVDALWGEIDGLAADSPQLTEAFVADIAERIRRAWAAAQQ